MSNFIRLPLPSRLTKMRNDYRLISLQRDARRVGGSHIKDVTVVLSPVLTTLVLCNNSSTTKWLQLLSCFSSTESTLWTLAGCWQKDGVLILGRSDRWSVVGEINLPRSHSQSELISDSPTFPFRLLPKHVKLLLSLSQISTLLISSFKFQKIFTTSPKSR